MNEATLSLGGLSLRLCGGDSVGRVMQTDGMLRFVSDTPHCETSIILDADIRPAITQVLHSFDVADGGSRCLFGTDSIGSYVYQFEGFGTVLFDPARPNEARLTTFADTSVARFAMWTAFSMIGLWHNVLPVHSSVAVHGGKAVMCLGESGTGKSTHTRLWIENIPDTYLLNDDSPLLNTAGPQPVVHGSPWSGKTPCYLQEARKVAAAVRIVQQPENNIVHLNTLEAFAALQPSCPPCLMKDERLQDRLVDFVGRFIAATPVYRLGCRPDAEAARLCHNTLFDQ